MKKHFFVIVNYNSGENLISCIENILHSKEITPHIIIVDNASRDNSLEA
ncbi:MAG: glycosyltransferase, partial [Patescibacteria group bacterium]